MVYKVKSGRNMAMNSNSLDEDAAEFDPHARVLRAVHQEFLDHGLVLQQQPAECPNFGQSSAGAFPPLRYGDVGGGGRVIMVRALAIFDDLIVNATATSPRVAGDCDLDGEIRRRIKLNVMTWAPLLLSGEAEAAAGVGNRERSKAPLQQRHQKQRDGETAPLAAAAAAAEGGGGGRGGGREGTNDEMREEGSSHTLAAATATATATAAATPPAPFSPSREAFRSRVLSGLLLHLCPPPGHFADLFGCGDELRRRILGMLDARDLATFGMASRSAAVSAVSNSLWSLRLQADFSESEQREGVALALPPRSSLERAYHHDRQRRSTSGGECGDHVQEGRLWRCYGELVRVRRRREAKRQALLAEERHRVLQLVGFMGRRSRAPYPAGLPRGPYHTPGPPVFPGYDWGPGVGDPADVLPLSPPSSIWGRGGWAPPLRGWGRGAWRR